MKKLVLLLFIVFSMASSACADHIIGTDLTYQKLDSNHYRVRLVFYRNCNGCRMNQDTATSCGNTDTCSSRLRFPTWLMVRGASGSCNGTLMDSISLSRISITDASGTCNTAQNRCNKPCGSAFPYGVEAHVFTGDLDVSRMRDSGCCRLNLSITLDARSDSITTGQKQTTFYTDAEMYICGQGNSSPSYFNYPLFFGCCGQTVSYAVGAIDSVDRDSISFHLVAPRTSATSYTSYASGLDVTSPVPTYHPSSCVTKTLQSNPPIGFNFDSIGGVVVFNPATSICTPVSCPYTGLISIESREWRRIGGVMTIVGRITREMQVKVMNCPANDPPSLAQSNFQHACEDRQFCSTILSYDAPGDTVTVKWSGGLPSGWFRTPDLPVVHKSVGLCFTPPVGSARTAPYPFYLEAEDKACPVKARYSQAYFIAVKPKARGHIQSEMLSCSRVKVSVPDAENVTFYEWSVLDTTRMYPGPSIVDKNGSYKAIDTFTFKKPGRYMIMLRINNSYNCETRLEDTLIVEHNAISISDTVACYFQNLELRAQIEDSNYLSLRWQNSEADSFQTFIFNDDSSQWVHAELITNTCTYGDSAFIRVPDKIRLGNDTNLCRGDSVELRALNEGPLFNNYHWSAVDTFMSLMVRGPGTYHLTATDTNSCVTLDSMIVNHLSHALDLPDTAWFCKGDSVQIGQENGLKNWQWQRGDTTPFIQVNISALYILHATDTSNNCALYDTILAVQNSHALDLPDTARFCKGDSVQIGQANGLKNWSWVSGQFTPFIHVGIPGTYILQASDSANDCQLTDTVVVVKDSVPPFDFNINLIGTNTYRFSTTIDGSRFEWDFGDGSDTVDFDSSMIHSYNVIGNYKICLRISNFNNCSDTLCKWVLPLSTGKPCFPPALLFYPNPFDSKLNLDFYAVESGVLNVSAYDMMGKEYILIRNEKTEGGKSCFTIDAEGSGLPQGLLLLKISFGNTEKWVKLIRISE